MSPQLSLKILLAVSVISAIFLFVFFKTQQQYNSVTLSNLEHQLEMQKRIQEAEAVLGDGVDKRNLDEKTNDLIGSDLKNHGSVTPETVQKIIDLANAEIRRKNGLPPN